MEHPDRDGDLTLSIVIPVFNERATIGTVLDAVLAAELPAGIRKEVIVIDDGSTDGTGALLEALGDPGVRVVRHVRNLGKGAAIRTALDHVTGEWLLIQDADLEYRVEDYPGLMAALLRQDKGSIVFGSRFLGEIRDMQWPNYIANKLLTAATNLLYGCRITDLCTGYKLYRVSEVRSLELGRSGFDLEHEITAKLLRKNHHIVEVPISYYGRTARAGKKVRWWDFFADLYVLVRVRLG